MPRKTRVMEDSFQGFVDTIRIRGYCEIPDITKLIRILQTNEMDCHIGVCGQNGSGKTFLELMLGKDIAGSSWKDDLLLSDRTTNDLIQFLLTRSKCPMLIDEANLYLSYKQHASIEQNHLMNMIELARSKEIAVISCMRDPRKYTLNYRDGKLSVVLWMMDRYADRSGAFAAVLVAAMSVEGEDRFGWQYLDTALPDYETIRAQIEEMPSFVGWLKIPSAKKYLSDKEIAEYKKYKEIAMAKAHLNYCVKRFVKKQMDRDEFDMQLEQLRKVLGDAEIDSAINALHAAKSKQALLEEF